MRYKMDFDNIYEEYFDRIYYKVLSVVKNDDDAEDICQETFISVYKNLSKFREESNIYTWIYRIAINKTYDFFKKRKLEFEINEDVLSLPEDINFDTSLILEEKLKLIPEKEKEIVLMKDIYGYKLKEIAEIKNMNLSTVKSVYYKAIKDMGGN
jgi:RNA polymerase sigma factor, sigma-70 family